MKSRSSGEAVGIDLDEAKDMVDVVLAADKIDLSLDVPEDQDRYLRLLLDLAALIQRERHHRERME